MHAIKKLERETGKRNLYGWVSCEGNVRLISSGLGSPHQAVEQVEWAELAKGLTWAHECPLAGSPSSAPWFSSA